MFGIEPKDVYFTDSCGRSILFDVYPLWAERPQCCGVYIYIHVFRDQYTALYIDETENFNEIGLALPKWYEISRQFCNAIGVKIEKNVSTRQRLKASLIEAQKPVCNSV